MTNKDNLSRRGFLRLAGTSAGAAATVGLLSACVVPVATPAAADEQDMAAIKEVITSGYQGAVNSHDAAAYAGLFADDVLWAPPNAPNATSKEAIQSAVQGLFDTFTFEVEVTPDEVEVMGDFAYVIGQAKGNLTPRNGDPVRPIHFQILWLLRKGPDGWKIARQIWNNKPIPE
jgi:uncharacterized protein (TIGR02246 family)